MAEAFTNLGFPAYFRVELAWAKLLGVVLLLAPVPARLKEWAYAGFAITLGSALIAHFAVGDGPEAWGFAAGTGVLWGLCTLVAPPGGHTGERLVLPFMNTVTHRGRRERARLARREEGEYREHSTDEQRGEAGCLGGRMPPYS